MTYPGAKSVHRFGDNTFQRDVLVRTAEGIGGRELLVEVVTDGEVVDDFLALKEIREWTMSTVERLPAKVRAVENPAEYSVDVSDRLTKAAEQVQSQLRREMGL